MLSSNFPKCYTILTLFIITLVCKRTSFCYVIVTYSTLIKLSPVLCYLCSDPQRVPLKRSLHKLTVRSAIYFFGWIHMAFKIILSINNPIIMHLFPQHVGY